MVIIETTVYPNHVGSLGLPVFLSPDGRRRQVGNVRRAYSSLREIDDLPRELVLYLPRHEHGTKFRWEKVIEFARRLLGHQSVFIPVTHSVG